MVTVVVICVRLDVVSIIHWVWLLFLIFLPRRFVHHIWPFYVISLSVMLPAQYLMCLGLYRTMTLLVILSETTVNMRVHVFTLFSYFQMFQTIIFCIRAFYRRGIQIYLEIGVQTPNWNFWGNVIKMKSGNVKFSYVSERFRFTEIFKNHEFQKYSGMPFLKALLNFFPLLLTHSDWKEESVLKLVFAYYFAPYS